MVAVLPGEGTFAQRADALKADQGAAGGPSHLPDLLIAAHALALGMILVTSNTKRFSAIPGLSIEDWL